MTLPRCLIWFLLIFFSLTLTPACAYLPGRDPRPSFKNHLPISAAGRRLEHFFQVYAPNRVKDVPKLFHLYEGHVDKLFERVRRQYGVSETELPHVDVMHAHNEL